MTGPLIFVVVAGLTVGDDRSPPLGELTKTKVDFSGHWSGEYHFHRRPARELEIRDNILNIAGAQVADMHCTFHTCRPGWVVVGVRGYLAAWQGIYKIEPGRIVLSFSVDSNRPPASFVPTDSTEVWVLRRYKE